MAGGPKADRITGLLVPTLYRPWAFLSSSIHWKPDSSLLSPLPSLASSSSYLDRSIRLVYTREGEVLEAGQAMQAKAPAFILPHITHTRGRWVIGCRPLRWLGHVF